MGLLVASQPLLGPLYFNIKVEERGNFWVYVFLGLVWFGTLLFKYASVNYAKDLP